MTQETAQVAPSARTKWIRIFVSILAAIGALAIALVGYVAFREKPHEYVSIDQGETIEQVMMRSYGKYSESHKGWLYVGPGNRTYVMRVVQQAKIEAVGAPGDELYFVASGTPLDKGLGTIFGAFQIRPDLSKKEPALIEVSSPYIFEGDAPVTPERVLFEALSGRTWGWIIKVKTGSDPKKELVHVYNLLLAPSNDQIVRLASFHASLESDPGIDCEEANRKYDQWLITDSKDTFVTSNDSQEPTSENNSEDEPMRCNKGKWTYRTGPVTSDDAFVPIYITGKGVRNGAPVDDKTVKVMFDSKSNIYLIPEDLTVY